MHQSKIVHFLKNLDSSQRRKFRLFVQSPYFNQHQNTIKLLALLETGLKKGGQSLDKEILIKKMFPTPDTNESNFFNAVSFLLRLFYRFQTIENFEQDDFETQLYLLKTAQEGQQDRLFDLTIQKLKTNFKHHSNMDADFYQKKYRFYRIQANRQQKEKKRRDYPMLQAASDHLDLFFIIEKLRLCCNMLAETAVVSNQYNLSFLEQVLLILEQDEQYQNYPAIQMYVAILNMLQEANSAECYQEVRQLMNQHLSIFSKAEALVVEIISN